MKKILMCILVAMVSGISCDSPTEDVSPPLKPSPSAPADGAIDQSVSPVLSWNQSGEASSYGLQMSTDSLFTTILHDLSGLTDTSRLISGLSHSIRYYWRVNATNRHGTSAWSDTWSFMTIGVAPPIPELSLPLNNATDQPVSVILEWNASSGATSYTLQVSTASNFASFVYNDSGLTGTTQQVTGLANNVEYFWRVRAKNSYGYSGWSGVWKYTTESKKITVTSIEILNLIPEPESTVTSSDTITASLLYSIADNIQSSYGFSVTIKFVSTIVGQTFSVGTGGVTVNQREGSVTIEYPLEVIWNHQNLKHPVSCYFYLHKMTSSTSSTVIASTPRINYKE